MKKKQFLFVLLAIIIGFSNCKKSKQPPITPVDNTNKNIQLLLGNWKLTAMFSERPHDWNGDGTQETDMYYFLDSCDRQYFYKFTADHKGVLSTNCVSGAIFTWSLESYGNKIRRVNQFNNVAYEDIVNITTSELTVSYKRDAPFPERQPFTITAKFKKQ